MARLAVLPSLPFPQHTLHSACCMYDAAGCAAPLVCSYMGGFWKEAKRLQGELMQKNGENQASLIVALHGQ
eukprot:649744-Pelagomonas_calceolata.AAC.1